MDFSPETTGSGTTTAGRGVVDDVVVEYDFFMYAMCVEEWHVACTETTVLFSFLGCKKPVTRRVEGAIMG